jgi:hypothetical protein
MSKIGDWTKLTLVGMKTLGLGFMMAAAVNAAGPRKLANNGVDVYGGGPCECASYLRSINWEANIPACGEGPGCQIASMTACSYVA